MINKFNVRKVWIVSLMLISALFADATNTTFLVDVSGSMEGLSKDRTIKSLDKVKNEFRMYFESNRNDSNRIVTFTDRINDSFLITPNSTEIESRVEKFLYPQKGNTNLKIALENVDNSNPDRIVIISDGRHNIGDYINIIEKLKSNKVENKRRQYFLLLEESDLETPLVKEFSNSDYISIIRSLSELSDANTIPLDKAENEDYSATQSADTIATQVDIADDYQLESVNSDKTKQGIDCIKIILWILIGFITLFCVYWWLFKPTWISFIFGSRMNLKNINSNMENLSVQQCHSDEQQNDGKYAIEISPSIYKINRSYVIPNGSQHKNPTGKTCGQILDELNDTDGIIKIKEGEPVFDKDGGTVDGTPLEASFPEGIVNYLNPEELNRGKKINRNKLHDEAFRRIAKKYGMDEDELQVFKGNSAPVERLMKKWNCSEQEVYNRCRNPYRIARVLHECKDGKTVKLVPWVYHHLSHYGGIEAVASRY